MHMLACDWLFDGKALLSDHTLHLGGDGVVTHVEPGLRPGAERRTGLVSPAFVNAHCHLELSHMRGLIPRGTGMAGFVRALQPLRDRASVQERAAAMDAAVREMRAGGIAAVGDICNGLDSLAVKQAHPEMHFFSFIERFGLNPGMAEEIFFSALELLRDYGRHASITPHAPYSISVALRDKLLGYARRREWPISIHLLESVEERRLFEDLDGPLMDFIRDIGAVFQAHTYHSAADFILDGLPTNCNVLLVHATEMTAAELDRIMAHSSSTFIVLCPLANAYIHGTQPPAQRFAAYPDRICLGTDSLAGNDRLSILAEARQLQLDAGLDTALLLRWATANGAAALDLDVSRYSIAVGRKPALIHIPDFAGQLSSLPPDPIIQFIQS